MARAGRRRRQTAVISGRRTASLPCCAGVVHRLNLVCAGTASRTAAFSPSTCRVELPADLRISQVEAPAQMVAGGQCGLKADPSLRAQFLRIEKGDDEVMRAVLGITSEE